MHTDTAHANLEACGWRFVAPLVAVRPMTPVDEEWTFDDEADLARVASWLIQRPAAHRVDGETLLRRIRRAASPAPVLRQAAMFEEVA